MRKSGKFPKSTISNSTRSVVRLFLMSIVRPDPTRCFGSIKQNMCEITRRDSQWRKGGPRRRALRLTLSCVVRKKLRINLFFENVYLYVWDVGFFIRIKIVFFLYTTRETSFNHQRSETNINCVLYKIYSDFFFILSSNYFHYDYNIII